MVLDPYSIKRKQESELSTTKTSHRRRGGRNSRFVITGGKKYDLFQKLLEEQFSAITRVLAYLTPSGNASFLTPEGSILCKSYGIKDAAKLEENIQAFRSLISGSVKLAYKNVTNREENELFYRLREAFVKQEVLGLKRELKFCFLRHLMGKEEDARTKKKY